MCLVFTAARFVGLMFGLGLGLLLDCLLLVVFVVYFVICDDADLFACCYDCFGFVV